LGWEEVKYRGNLPLLDRFGGKNFGEDIIRNVNVGGKGGT